MAIEKLPEITAKDQVMALVAEDCIDSAIIALNEKYKGLKATDDASYELVKKGHREFVARRTSVEKRRLSLKRDVDTEAARITKLLEPGELELKTEKEKWEADIKAKAEAAALKEKQRVDKIRNRIYSFSAHLNNLMTKSASELKSDLDFLKSCIDADTFNYEEFVNEAQKTKLDTEQALTKTYNERKALEDREAEIKKQQAIIDEANRIISEKAAADKLEQEKLTPELPDALPESVTIEYDSLVARGKVLLTGAVSLPSQAYEPPSTGTYSMGQGAKLEILIGFIREITQAGGRYADLNGHQIVSDAYKVLQKIGEANAKNNDF